MFLRHQLLCTRLSAYNELFNYSYYLKETSAKPSHVAPRCSAGGDEGRAQIISGILIVGVTLDHDFQPQSVFGCFKGLQSFLQRKPMGH